MDHCRFDRSTGASWRREGRGAVVQSHPLDQERPDGQRAASANGEQSKKLASQLQALLPARTKLEDACTAFRQLSECVAALHVSHNLKIKFNCLKWDVTGLKPASGNVS